MEDLFDLTTRLVGIASESRSEAELVSIIEARLVALSHLEVTRVGENIVARTRLGRSTRIILAGHTDTVPANGNAAARVADDWLWGVGSADMKGGLAIMLASATEHITPAVDVTYVFYAREEIAASESGLGELFVAVPELLEGDLAILGEPTDGAIEAGCQGSVRATVTLRGARAHTARAWMGRNAVHRLGGVLAALGEYEPRRPIINGCQFHEALLAVGVNGGTSGNVVPDQVELSIGHRFAPDRTSVEAERHVREFLSPFLEDCDLIEIVDIAPAAAPAVDHPLIEAAIARHGLGVDAKLGWTDVARFSERGVPAVNLGPGDPTLAHTAEERLHHDSLLRTWSVIDDIIVAGAGVI